MPRSQGLPEQGGRQGCLRHTHQHSERPGAGGLGSVFGQPSTSRGSPGLQQEDGFHLPCSSVLGPTSALGLCRAENPEHQKVHHRRLGSSAELGGPRQSAPPSLSHHL